MPASPTDPRPAEDPTRPRVVVSQCLGFAAVRYDGERLESPFVDALRDRVEFVQVCPEVGMGMGVPRDPIRVVVEGGEPRLHQPSTGRDWTAEMRAFSEGFLGALGAVDGFILKSRSPSCGISDTKIYEEGEGDRPVGRGSGLFARAVQEAYPWAALQDEERLGERHLRHHFLAHLWTLARLREVGATGDPHALARFHAEHRLLLRDLSPEGEEELERIAADAAPGSFAHVFGSYRDRLGLLFSGPARLPEPGDWIGRSSGRYLAKRRRLEPYPHELVTLSPAGDDPADEG